MVSPFPRRVSRRSEDIFFNAHPLFPSCAPARDAESVHRPPASAQTADPVTNLAAASGDQKLSVTWTNPSGAGTGLTDISIRWRVQGTTTWTSHGSNLVGATTSFEITGLTNNTTYEVEVSLFWAALSTSSSWTRTTGTPLPPPTVSLSASPNPVLEGGSLTVVATLSRALSSDVRIPLTATAGSAESGDYVQISDRIRIKAGTLSGGSTGASFFMDQDTDEDDETFTIALGTLPSSVTAGTPSSVTITIRDDDRFVLGVEATPACGAMVTDMSVVPQYGPTLTPAPSAAVETERRVVSSLPDYNNPWIPGASIEAHGRSFDLTRNNTFAQLRRSYNDFAGFEYRLKETPAVTARCVWTFSEQTPRDNDKTSNTGSPTVSVPPTGGGPSPGGGGSPPTAPSDPAPDSPRCGTDREDLKRFYKMTGGEGWNRNEYWNSREPLGEWYGVETEDGSVVSLHLPDNNLSGDMPTRELLCLEDKELVELALWGNDDLEGEVPPELVLAVERAALRDIAETLDIYPEWFEDYGDPYDFKNWHEGVTTDDERRVTGLDLTGEGVIGELPESVSELRRLGEIMITTSSEDGGCALSPKDSSAFSLFLLTLLVFAALVRKERGADSFPPTSK